MRPAIYTVYSRWINLAIIGFQKLQPPVQDDAAVIPEKAAPVQMALDQPMNVFEDSVSSRERNDLRDFRPEFISKELRTTVETPILTFACNVYSGSCLPKRPRENAIQLLEDHPRLCMLIPPRWQGHRSQDEDLRLTN
jgi:hypothetical protein